MSDRVIELKAVSKGFTLRRVLDKVSFTVDSGQTVFLCGVNGAGKTTLLKIISGLLTPDAGTVKLCGASLKHDPEKAKQHLGVISHKSMLYPDLSVTENLSFFADLYGVPDSKSRITELLAEAKLASYRHDKVTVLSRGLLQRLAIARALIHAPSILLADEPFTGLDTDSCLHLKDTLSRFAGDGGTVVMTTHETHLGLLCSSRVLLLDGSQVTLDRQTAEIETDRFVDDYLSYAREKR
ncbi:MAG: heme ABC exporter ATP-binding protein CcmA [Planctomycetota bacterium]|jgi:heme exporter protein A